MAAPDYLLGEHLSVITVAALTLTTGTWTPATAVDIHAYILSVEETLEVQSDDIRPVWSKQVNMVPHSIGESCTLQCLNHTASANTLNQLARTTASKRVQVVWTAGDETLTGFFTLSRATTGVTSHGQNTSGWDLVPMDPGNSTAQVAYVAA